MPQDPQQDEFIKRKVSQYAISEDMGVSLLSQMLGFVPGDEERIFLESQVEDEKKHNRLFAKRADELGSEEKFFQDSLQKLYDFSQSCVDRKDWLMCVACQSIIEELALASFSAFYTRADEKTKIILDEIMGDERRHLDFALWQIGKWSKTPEDRKKVLDLQHRVLQIFLEALKPENLQQQLDAGYFKKVLKQTYALHKQRFSKLELEVPEIPVQYLRVLL